MANGHTVYREGIASVGRELANLSVKLSRYNYLSAKISLQQAMEIVEVERKKATIRIDLPGISQPPPISDRTPVVEVAKKRKGRKRRKKDGQD